MKVCRKYIVKNQIWGGIESRTANVALRDASVVIIPTQRQIVLRNHETSFSATTAFSFLIFLLAWGRRPDCFMGRWLIQAENSWKPPRRLFAHLHFKTPKKPESQADMTEQLIVHGPENQVEIPIATNVYLDGRLRFRWPNRCHVMSVIEEITILQLQIIHIFIQG